MTIERLEEIEIQLMAETVGQIFMRNAVVDLIEDSRRLRTELNAIQKAEKEAQDG